MALSRKYRAIHGRVLLAWPCAVFRRAIDIRGLIDDPLRELIRVGRSVSPPVRRLGSLAWQLLRCLLLDRLGLRLLLAHALNYTAQARSPGNSV